MSCAVSCVVSTDPLPPVLQSIIANDGWSSRAWGRESVCRGEGKKRRIERQKSGGRIQWGLGKNNNHEDPGVGSWWWWWWWWWWWVRAALRGGGGGGRNKGGMRKRGGFIQTEKQANNKGRKDLRMNNRDRFLSEITGPGALLHFLSLFSRRPPCWRLLLHVIHHHHHHHHHHTNQHRLQRHYLVL